MLLWWPTADVDTTKVLSLLCFSSQVLQTLVSPSIKSAPSVSYSYDNGYGDVLTEYWLGNDPINWMLADTPYVLRISLQLESGMQVYQDYMNFSLDTLSSEILAEMTSSFDDAANSSEFNWRSTLVVDSRSGAVLMYQDANQFSNLALAYVCVSEVFTFRVGVFLRLAEFSHLQ